MEIEGGRGGKMEFYGRGGKMVMDIRTPLRGRRGKRVADGFLDVVIVVLDDEDELLAAGRQPLRFEEHCWFGGAYCMGWRSFVTKF